jgi:phage N-6-adenine-methyltransferase
MRGYNGSKTKESIRDLWQTPKWLFDYYHRRFDFKMDVAASPENTFVKGNYWTDKENALDQNWSVWGNWCNPPYSNINPWVEKAIEELKRGCLTVMIIPADTSVKWFKLAFENCSECHFISGRIAFINSETQKPVSGNNKGSVVFVFDPHSPIKSQVCLLDRDKIKAH